MRCIPLAGQDFRLGALPSLSKLFYCFGLVVLVIASVLTCTKPAVAEERIHFLVKAFIPNSLPVNPDYVMRVPAARRGRSSKTMIPHPVPNGLCFMTDNRGFSNEPSASARLTTEFILVLSESDARVEKAGGRDIHRCDATEKVQCVTGAVLETATAKPRTAIFRESYGIGRPAVSGTKYQVAFQASAPNPLTIAGFTPDIDYSFDLTFDSMSKELKFRATTGVFPAFEAYARLNDGDTVPLFQRMPTGKSVKALYDGGTGLGTQTITGTVVLGRPATSEWSLRVWNVDDRVDLYVNGLSRGNCGFDAECEWKLNRWLEFGTNTIELRLYNVGGPYRYAYRLKSNRETTAEAACGDASRSCINLGGPYRVGTGSFTRTIFSDVIEVRATGQ